VFVKSERRCYRWVEREPGQRTIIGRNQLALLEQPAYRCQEPGWVFKKASAQPSWIVTAAQLSGVLSLDVSRRSWSTLRISLLQCSQDTLVVPERRADRERVMVSGVQVFGNARPRESDEVGRCLRW